MKIRLFEFNLLELYTSAYNRKMINNLRFSFQGIFLRDLCCKPQLWLNG